MILKPNYTTLRQNSNLVIRRYIKSKKNLMKSDQFLPKDNCGKVLDLKYGYFKWHILNN